MTTYKSHLHTFGIEKYTIFKTQKQTGDFHPYPFIQQSNTFLIDHDK